MPKNYVDYIFGPRIHLFKRMKACLYLLIVHCTLYKLYNCCNRNMQGAGGGGRCMQPIYIVRSCHMHATYHAVVGDLDEPYSAKPSQRSSHNFLFKIKGFQVMLPCAFVS